MTKKEILKKLITYYTKHIKVIKEKKTFKSAYKYTDDNHLDMGICWVSDKLNLHRDLYNLKWVKKECSDGCFWYDIAFNAVNKKEILERVQFRLDKMKKILKTCK